MHLLGDVVIFLGNNFHVELNESVLFYLQRDYDFIGALMLYCQYSLYLGMFKHSYSHLQNSLARLSS